MPKILRYSLIGLLVALFAAGAAIYGLYRATQRVPSFYTAELAVATQIQEKESDRMLRQALTLHNNLQRRCQWQENIEAKTINAWLAVELPRNHPDLLPSGMRDPRVHIGPEGITLACRVDRGWIHGVVSLQVSAFVESADVIGLRVHTIRLARSPGRSSRCWTASPTSPGSPASAFGGGKSTATRWPC